MLGYFVFNYESQHTWSCFSRAYGRLRSVNLLNPGPGSHLTPPCTLNSLWATKHWCLYPVNNRPGVPNRKRKNTAKGKAECLWKIPLHKDIFSVFVWALKGLQKPVLNYLKAERFLPDSVYESVLFSLPYKKGLQKLWLGWYLFKRYMYTFGTNICFRCTNMHSMKVNKVQSCTFFKVWQLLYLFSPWRCTVDIQFRVWSLNCHVFLFF